jgi:hypothetical protein
MEVTRNTRSIATESIQETSVSQEPERSESTLEVETNSVSASSENSGAASKIGEHALSGSLIANDLHAQVSAENPEPKNPEEPKEPKKLPNTFEDILFLLLQKYAGK